MYLLIDNYDSFTYNLLNYCKQINSNCQLIRNDEKSLEEITQMDPEGFIFSPGPGKPESHPLMNKIIDRWYNQKPILGICLGFQAIAEYFGAKTVKAPEPVHGKVSTIAHNGHFSFTGLPQTFQVTRYHSLISSDLENVNSLIITAKTKDTKLPMALAHNEYPLWGFQFHPEAVLTTHGLALLQNWFKQILQET